LSLVFDGADLLVGRDLEVDAPGFALAGATLTDAERSVAHWPGPVAAGIASPTGPLVLFEISESSFPGLSLYEAVPVLWSLSATAT
jgi:hypothetical protein